jgi:hypothetical protein
VLWRDASGACVVSYLTFARDLSWSAGATPLHLAVMYQRPRVVHVILRWVRAVSMRA